MKRTVIAIAALIAATISLSSCHSDDFNSDGMLINAVVTVKNVDGKCALQIDDSTKVYPTNVKDTLFGGKEVRALTQLTAESAKSLVDGQDVQILWIDSILTKKVIIAEDGIDYGNDPVDIYNDWLTVAEDGYVTLHIRSSVGYNAQPHIVNLVSGTNPENPCELVFHHDAKGDVGGMASDAVVAFNVRDILPETAGDVTLTIKFESSDGPKSFTLKTKVK